MSGDYHGFNVAVAQQFIDNFEGFRNGEPLHNVVDKVLGYNAQPPTSQNRSSIWIRCLEHGFR